MSSSTELSWVLLSFSRALCSELWSLSRDPGVSVFKGFQVKLDLGKIIKSWFPVKRGEPTGFWHWSAYIAVSIANIWWLLQIMEAYEYFHVPSLSFFFPHHGDRPWDRVEWIQETVRPKTESWHGYLLTHWFLASFLSLIYYVGKAGNNKHHGGAIKIWLGNTCNRFCT